MAVLAIMVLGVVTYLKMTPDLLPNMDFPYVVIVTTDPGASPETVEAEITKPMEQAMATLNEIKHISSTSQNSMSMVVLEFEQGVNMDSTGVDIQQKIAILQGGWDDTVGTPYVLKINPTMLPVEIAAVSRENTDVAELSEFVEKTLTNKMEGITGVASVSVSGLLKRQMNVILSQEKMDALSGRLAEAVNEQLDAAQTQLEQTRQQLLDAKAMIRTAEETAIAQAATKALEAVRDSMWEMEAQAAQLTDKLAELQTILQRKTELEMKKAGYDARIAAIERNILLTEEQKAEQIAAVKAESGYVQMEAELAEIDLRLAALGTDWDHLLEEIEKTSQQLAALQEKIRQFKEDNSVLAGMVEKITSGAMTVADGAQQIVAGNIRIDTALTQLEAGFATLEQSRASALEQTNLKNVLQLSTVGALLTAQNFSMPAGYIEDGNGVQYMVSVGDNISTREELQRLILFDLGMEGVEPIRLEDVAEVFVTDNSGQIYAKLNGENGVTLTFNKQSTYATAEVSENISRRFEELTQEYEGLHFTPLMDQGDYIRIIIHSILSSLAWGALFAILILYLFLRDLRPTAITLAAIPVSVIFAVVLMYFCGVTINMISLSGLAVAVGMLVDNSVVVIENIHRLRGKGASAIQAAVAGAGQVAGAVTASTLTTVCVFLPIVFVKGITRQLFTDLALTMSYALLASLIVSLTLVPAMASGMLRKKKKEKQDGFFASMLRGYGKLVSFALNHKLLVLALAVAALILTAWLSVARGFTFMPDMDMPSVNITVTMPEDYDMAQATELADEILARVSAMDGIETAGAMMSSGGSSLLGMGGGSSGASLEATLYITLSDDGASGARMGEKIIRECADLPCEITASSAMMDMSALTGSGITLELYGENMDVLQNAARAAAEALERIEGVRNVSDGLEDAAPALHIQVDRDKAMSQGLTIAQIYMEVSQALSNIQQAQTLVLSGTTTDIVVERPMEHRLDVDMLKDYTFETTGMDGETNTFRLTDVAEIEETTSLDAISRKNQRRCLTVTAEVADGYNVTLITNQAAKEMETLDLGEGVSYAFTGENETIMEAVEQLLLMLLLGVLLVYLVMVAQFQSLKSPFIVMFTIPLAFTGGFLALLVCGMEISVISLVGFVMLTGIIVNNGIVLVDYINQLRADGMERRAAIAEAGKTRMRPILMTSVTTILGLADMALSRSAGSAIMQPIAVVCIGGLIYATLMTLLVVPCIYDIVNKKELRVVRDEDMQLKENM